MDNLEIKRNMKLEKKTEEYGKKKMEKSMPLYLLMMENDLQKVEYQIVK